MANNFKSYQQTSVTTEQTVYTGPVDTQSTIIGMTVANTSTNAVMVDVKLNTAYLVKGAPVPLGGSLVVIGGNQKVVVEPTDTISVSASNTVDVITSALEISQE